MIDEKLLIKELNCRVRTPRSTMEIIRDIIPLVEMQPKISVQEIRDKAIEEFAEKIVINSNRLNICTDDFEKFGDTVANIIYEIAEQIKETEEPFFNFGSPVVDADKKVIRKFAEWCYIHGVDFSYMSTAEKSGEQFIDDVIERYGKEQMKEVGE